MDAIRVAMWSGPRNLSTAMMRAFGNRPDTAVVDEPFYAAYLAATGLIHPMREAVIASQPTDWREVARDLLGPVPEGRSIFYQKHMTHHMIPAFGRGWIASCRNAFLIRDPVEVLASYVEKRSDVTLDDIGLAQQVELFEREADRLGSAPPVIDGADMLADPRGMLAALCAALGIPFAQSMLSWPPGRRATDGVWAPAWYESVERSTGFSGAPAKRADHALPDAARALLDRAHPLHARLAAFRLVPAGTRTLHPT